MDVSVDGSEEDHDAIRGKGAFERARPNIEWLTKTFGARVFASLTVQRRNVRRLPQAVQVLHDLGVQTVGVAFYTPTPVTDPLLALEDSEVEAFFADLELLGQVAVDHPLAVQLDVNCAFGPGLFHFLSSPWSDPLAWEEDLNGSLYNQYALQNGLELQFRITPWPQPFSDVARVNADGQILLGEDALNTTLYSERALANLGRHDFDLHSTWVAAARSPRFREALESSSRAVVPGLQKSRSAEVLRSHGALPCAA
jgi:hypothetical protein